MTAPNIADVANEAPEGATSTAPSDVLATRAPDQSRGPLLDEADEKKVVDAVVQLLTDQAPSRARRRAEWECYKLWLKGVRGARVRRQNEDRNAVELVVPLGAYDLPPVMDRVDELAEKVVAHIVADPAIPDAEPATDSDADRDAAEFTTRVLTVEGAESGYNNDGVTRRAARKSCVYGSGFVYMSVDPTGGGWRPMEVRALSTSQTMDDATLDPATGQTVGADDPRLATRYVMATGQLTDDPRAANKQWLPKLVPDVVTGEQVVLLPATCSGVNDAHGCLVIRYTPLGKLRQIFAKRLGQELSDEDAQKLVDWNPSDTKHAQPGFLQGKMVKGDKTASGKVKDSALVCTLSLYYTSHGSYPYGAYIVVGGGAMVLHR